MARVIHSYLLYHFRVQYIKLSKEHCIAYRCADQVFPTNLVQKMLWMSLSMCRSTYGHPITNMSDATRNLKLISFGTTSWTVMWDPLLQAYTQIMITSIFGEIPEDTWQACLYKWPDISKKEKKGVHIQIKEKSTNPEMHQIVFHNYLFVDLVGRYYYRCAVLSFLILSSLITPICTWIHTDCMATRIEVYLFLRRTCKFNAI